MTRKIQYFIDPQDTIGHYYNVRMIWEPEQDIQSVELVMPSWTPGSYMIRDYARLVHGFSANCAWEQTGLSKWELFPNKNKKSKPYNQIEVEYKVYAFEDLTVRTNHLEENFGLINSPAMFFYIKEWMDTETNSQNNHSVSISISFELGKPFSFIHTPLERVSEFQFLAKSWDELYDSPFFLNNKKAEEYISKDTKHHLVVEGNIYHSFQDQLLTDLKRITDLEIDMMGGSPNKNYLFVLILSDGKYGGLEHAACSINLFDLSKVNSEPEYKKLLELLAHEYFHLWNVKRIRPIALGPFDYEKPNLTKELWIAEGITSFYDGYFLLKAGILNREEYLEKIMDDILNLEDNLGEEIMSLEESSLTAWTKLYKRTNDSPNTSISYYTKGAILILCMHIRILYLSEGNQDFSGIMKFLYKKFYIAQERGFTKEEFFLAVKETVGSDLYPEFAPYIEEAKRIPVNEYLDLIGVERREFGELSDPGFNCNESEGGLFIQKIFRGRIDPLANLYLGDEILAINEERVRTKNQWTEILKSIRPGETAKLTISRNRRLKEVALTLGKKMDLRKLFLKAEGDIKPEILELREKFF